MNQARIILKPGVEIIAVETIDNPTDEEAYELGKLVYENGCLGRFTELSEEQCAQLVESFSLEHFDVPDKLGYKYYQNPNIIRTKQLAILYVGTAKESIHTALTANNIDPDKALIIKVNQ